MNIDDDDSKGGSTVTAPREDGSNLQARSYYDYDYDSVRYHDHFPESWRNVKGDFDSQCGRKW